MSNTDDYVLATHDGEIARLRLQHQVWRAHMLDAWMRAGMTKGSRVIDFGAGPGFASLDAAEIVGANGEVVGVERSAHFLRFARRQIERHDSPHVRFLERGVRCGVVPLGRILCRESAHIGTANRRLPAQRRKSRFP